MPRPDVVSGVARDVIEKLHSCIRAHGHGTLSQVSESLGFRPGYLSETMSRGVMDIGVFFAILEKLDIDPRDFISNGLRSKLEGSQVTASDHRVAAADRIMKRLREG